MKNKEQNITEKKINSTNTFVGVDALVGLPPIILDLCGGTGSWSKPYAEAGYEVLVITLPKYDVTKVDYLWWCLEFKDNEGNVLHVDVKRIIGVLAAPPCTQFSFARTNAKEERDLIKGMETVRACLDIIWFLQAHYENQYQKKSYLKFWALENPNGYLKYFLGKPVFEFQPFEFGDHYKKKTHIWGYFNVPKKIYSKDSEVMSEEEIKLCKTNSRKLPKFDKMKSKDIHPEYFGKLDRQARRAITPRGFATAFYTANR